MIGPEDWKEVGKKEEWINWIISILILLFIAKTGAFLSESWDSLNHLLIYTYAGTLFLYLLAEKAAYRGSDVKGRQSKKWTRSLLLLFWWVLLIVPVLEHIFYPHSGFGFYPHLNYNLYSQHNFAVTAVGASLALIGTGIRAWSMWTLGKYFSAHIEIKNDHQLIESGPYKFIRHPAYAGNILQTVGFPLILNAYFSLGISAVLILLFLYRLKLEEEILIREIKGYEDYTKRTDRLIPKLW